MPAPKAVLRDIADFNLDPTQKFGRISSKGRLAHDGNGVTTTTTQGKPPVTTGAHFRFYGKAVPHHEEPIAEVVHPIGEHVEAVIPPADVVPDEPVAEEKAEEKPPTENLPDTDQATPAAKKARFKKSSGDLQA